MYEERRSRDATVMCLAKDCPHVFTSTSNRNAHIKKKHPEIVLAKRGGHNKKPLHEKLETIRRKQIRYYRRHRDDIAEKAYKRATWGGYYSRARDQLARLKVKRDQNSPLPPSPPLEIKDNLIRLVEKYHPNLIKVTDSMPNFPRGYDMSKWLKKLKSDSRPGTPKGSTTILEEITDAIDQMQGKRGPKNILKDSKWQDCINEYNIWRQDMTEYEKNLNLWRKEKEKYDRESTHFEPTESNITRLAEELYAKGLEDYKDLRRRKESIDKEIEDEALEEMAREANEIVEDEEEYDYHDDDDDE